MRFPFAGTLLLAIVSVSQIPGQTEERAKVDKPVAKPARPDTQQKPLVGDAEKAFLAKIRKTMGQVQTIVATFDQEKHISLFDDGVVRHKGLILYQRPDKLRWEIRKPFRSILIVAGTEVAKFEFLKNKRRKLKLGRAADVLLIVMDQIRGWFRGDFEKSRKDYRVEFYAGTPARIVMRPKSAALSKTIQSFELLLTRDWSSVAQVTIREKRGDKTVMKFQRVSDPARPGSPASPELTPRKIDPKVFDVRDPQDFKLPTEKPTSRQQK